MRYLYTYLPKGNTAKTKGILSTRLALEGWEKYKERSGMKTKADVLKWLDSLAPGFKRSNAISVLTEPIPEDADPAIREFADAHELYAIPEYKELARLALVKAIRRINLGNRGGTVTINAPHYRRLDWKNIKPGKFLFSNTPHYLLETTQGKIPAEYVYDTKQRARQLLKELAERAAEERLPLFAVTEGASVTRNNGSAAVRAARKAHEKWERAHGEDPNEDWMMKKESSAITELAKQYYPEQGSHGWNHIEDVVSNARKMLNAKHEEFTPEVEAALTFHDSGLYPNGLDNPEVRGGHESRGARVAREALQKYFTKDQLRLIAAAIREHRGSYKGEYTSPLSELVSSADRGAPDIGKKIMRSYTYGLEHGWNQKRVIRNVIDQLSKKYGRQGYARYPSYYRALYAKELKDFQRTADSLTPEQVLEYVAKYSK